MLTIKKENLDEIRPDARNTAAENLPLGSSAQSDPDATQRVNVTAANGQPATAPAPRGTEPRQNRRPAPNTEQRAYAAARKKKKEKITVITLTIVASLMVLILLAVILVPLLKPQADDGKILNNVFAAGVNLGGMTPDQAKKALHKATDDTYSQLDMVVQVLDTTITLSPKDTGARLDVDAVVQAAYDFGRTGSLADQQEAQNLVQTTVYTIPLDQYLTLDKGYIRDAVNKLGKLYSTTLSQTSYKIEGTRPNLPNDQINVSTTHQTLYIYMGTAEYGLNTGDLYEQIMDAYNINLFQVTGECSVVAPNAPDFLDELYALCYTAPVDATIDPTTYVVTPEIYGYGISPSELNALLAEAKYGETLTIPLRYIEPGITTEILTGDLFQDLLSSLQTPVSENADWNANMTLACKALNGLIIKSGDEFSFNATLGEPTVRKGYRNVDIYLGKSLTSVTGGGISQVASMLYYCALSADLEILERSSHSYCPDFIDPGFDAQVYFGSLDLRFRNNTEQPIRIEAEIVGGNVQIRLIGTDNKDFTVDIIFEVTENKKPGTDYILLPVDNDNGYIDGDIISEGITGSTVITHRYTYDKSTGRLLSGGEIGETYYAKRNAVVVKLQEELVEPTDPTGPSEPTEPSQPSEPSASEPTIIP